MISDKIFDGCYGYINNTPPQFCNDFDFAFTIFIIFVCVSLATIIRNKLKKDSEEEPSRIDN